MEGRKKLNQQSKTIFSWFQVHNMIKNRLMRASENLLIRSDQLHLFKNYLFQETKSFSFERPSFAQFGKWVRAVESD